MLFAADFLCGGPADGRRRAARAARRWLARYAAGVKRISNQAVSDDFDICDCDAPASACARLVSCLPALERADLRIYGPLDRDNMGCLLEALASCKALRELDLFLIPDYPVHAPQHVPASGCAPAFAKLRGLTKLTLTLCDKYPYTLAEVIGALVSLTGLVNLWIQQDCSYVSPDAVVPAALGQLKGLQILQMDDLAECVFEAGSLDLPNLQDLRFTQCDFDEDVDAGLLPSVTALQSLTYINFNISAGPPCFAQLVHLPLRCMMFRDDETWRDDSHPGGCLGLSKLPADMGSLNLTLTYLDISGRRLAHFPLALTRLVALECLKVSANNFAEVPDGITALARLTKLTLGRVMCHYRNPRAPLPLHDSRRLDACALGDLSAFPALCALKFKSCEVMMRDAILGAARHASLASLVFNLAHPAPGCAPMVLQLSQALKRRMRGGVLRLADKYGEADCNRSSQSAQGPAPFTKFKLALDSCQL